jgi:hypothetical protein
VDKKHFSNNFWFKANHGGDLNYCVYYLPTNNPLVLSPFLLLVQKQPPKKYQVVRFYHGITCRIKLVFL